MLHILVHLRKRKKKETEKLWAEALASLCQVTGDKKNCP